MIRSLNYVSFTMKNHFPCHFNLQNVVIAALEGFSTPRGSLNPVGVSGNQRVSTWIQPGVKETSVIMGYCLCLLVMTDQARL